MADFGSARRFFEMPHVLVFLLLTVNCIVYALCLNQSGTTDIAIEVLLRNGAMYSAALGRHEYWRLFAHGFLHTGLIHLAVNMFCLVLWGGHLERRVGSSYFLIIYIGALVAGGVVSSYAHPGSYVMVGASGAISGIMGALLCLWILGRIELQADFFIFNIGLNVVLAAIVPNIDWSAHLGGFAAGMLACALLDVLERLLRFVLRCKFPELVKLNSLIVAAGLAMTLFGDPVISRPDHRLPLAAYAAACVIAIKLIDIVLSIKKGLAIVAIVFCVANPLLLWLWSAPLTSMLAASCVSRRAPALQVAWLVNPLCADVQLTLGAATAGLFVLTALLYSQELYRGIKDVGFVGATLQAERKRRQGI